jgi:hypothetical protein
MRGREGSVAEIRMLMGDRTVRTCLGAQLSRQGGLLRRFGSSQRPPHRRWLRTYMYQVLIPKDDLKE